MSNNKHPLYFYASVLEPWTRLAISTPDVVNLRLTLLPWLWLTDPFKASKETQRMVQEKSDAWQETAVAIGQNSVQVWFDVMSAVWSPDPMRAISRSMINSSRRAASPSNKRVNANRKRLSS